MNGCAFFKQFGEDPKGLDLEKIQASPYYVEGRFANMEDTPMFTDGSSPLGAFMDMVFTSVERTAPATALPAVKTDLKALPPNKDLVVWLGHSAYYIQLGGHRILIDPVFSAYASPLSFVNKAFKGTTIYSASDFPEIDYLLITHDHWDHLDYNSTLALKPYVKKVICGLGVGSHFRYWGYSETAVQEADWNTSLHVAGKLSIHVLTARHGSGRSFTRNPTLWAAFALQSPERKLFISGDGGYGKHFAKIGRRFGGFDLVILDSGQYNDKWRYIHMNPQEAAQAAEDLQAEALLPAHMGRFSLAKHSWDEPFIRIDEISRNKPYRLLTPIIGEVVDLNDPNQTFSRWWEGIK
jgi:L-ascorbate metabolism protein UlaG (beta-lactamase superfamily)